MRRHRVDDPPLCQVAGAKVERGRPRRQIVAAEEDEFCVQLPRRRRLALAMFRELGRVNRPAIRGEPFGPLDQALTGFRVSDQRGATVALYHPRLHEFLQDPFWHEVCSDRALVIARAHHDLRRPTSTAWLRKPRDEFAEQPAFPVVD